MTNVTFSNKSFQRTVKSIRRVMPILAVTLLILVYVVAAIAEGMFLSHLAGQFAIGAWLWYSISAVIQATRALLVYFPMLNPNRPTFGYQGETIAVVMGLIAIGSIWGAVDAIGLPHPVSISLSILMAAGIGVEVYLLREIKFSTEQEMFSNREYWEELAQFARAKRELQLFLDGIQDYEPDLDKLMPGKSQQPEPERQNKQLFFSHNILNAIGEADNLTQTQMDEIRRAIKDGWQEAEVIGMIVAFSTKNRKLRHERADAKAHNVPLDFSESEREDIPHPLQDAIRKAQNGNEKEDMIFLERMNLTKEQVKEFLSNNGNGTH